MVQCIIEGCEKLHKAFGWCVTHYRRWARHGDPTIVLPTGPFNRKCSFENCTNPHMARGWCVKHYERWKKNGDPARAQSYGVTNCSMPNCPNKHLAKGLCGRHYRQRIGHPRWRARKRGATISDFTHNQWLRILAAYNGLCAYCGKKFKELTQDHVIPLSKGGNHTASNIVPACTPCNSRKYNSTGKFFPSQPGGDQSNPGERSLGPSPF